MLLELAVSVLGALLSTPPHASAPELTVAMPATLLSTKFEHLQSEYGDAGARCLWRHLRIKHTRLLAHDRGGRALRPRRPRAAIASAYTPLSGVADVVSSLTTSDGTRKLLLRLTTATRLRRCHPADRQRRRRPTRGALHALRLSVMPGCRSATGDGIVPQPDARRDSRAGLCRARAGHPPTSCRRSNLVFMGMGEPADNAAVSAARRRPLRRPPLGSRRPR